MLQLFCQKPRDLNQVKKDQPLELDFNAGFPPMKMRLIVMYCNIKRSSAEFLKVSVTPYIRDFSCISSNPKHSNQPPKLSTARRQNLLKVQNKQRQTTLVKVNYENMLSLIGCYEHAKSSLVDVRLCWCSLMARPRLHSSTV